MTGAHHSLILNVIHDPSPYAAVVAAVSPVRSLEPGHTTAHRRHLAAAIFGNVRLSAEPKSDAALLCRCVGAAASASDPANIYADLARSLHYQVMPV